MKFYLLVILVFISSLPAFAQPMIEDDSPQYELSQFIERTTRITGKIVGVHDGDTCTLLDKNNVQYKIRFAGIDAPELKQDFGQAAKKNLSDLIFGKQVVAEIGKADKYGRSVAKIYVNGIDANLAQVKVGYAWHYKAYQNEQTLKDRTIYSEAESQAKTVQIGLWSQNNYIAPWHYRKGIRTPSNEKVENALIVTRANRTYIRGSRGGCYYINGSNKKTYVDRILCN